MVVGKDSDRNWRKVRRKKRLGSFMLSCGRKVEARSLRMCEGSYINGEKGTEPSGKKDIIDGKMSSSPSYQGSLETREKSANTVKF